MMMYKNEKKVILFFYTISIMMFMNFMSTIMIWIMMEVNMIVFILFMKMNQKSENINKNQELMFYFMIQTIGSILFLTSMNMETGLLMKDKILTVISISMKMGLFPLEKWIFKLSKNLEEKSFLILLTAQKIPMMLILMKMESKTMIIIMLMNMMMGAIMINKSQEMKSMLISSSIYTTLWMIMILSKSIMMFMIMYTKYSLANVMMLHKKLMGESKMSPFLILTATVLMMGLPPFDMFFIKIYILSFLEEVQQNTMNIILWLTTFIATLGYFKILYPNMMKKEKMLKMMKSTNLSKEITITFMMTSILMFI